jgi:L-amino acid N-acyltransferase YncA
MEDGYSLVKLGERHRGAVIDIFNRFVEEGFAAFPDQPVEYDFFHIILEMSRGYPAVAVRAPGGETVGFALLRPHLPFRNCARTAEVSWFILPEHTHRGVGRRILDAFTAEARERGIDNFIASVSSRNEESISFHRAVGFVERGRLRGVGRKFGRDFDVVLMQLHL